MAAYANIMVNMCSITHIINQPSSSSTEQETYYSVDGDTKALKAANQCKLKIPFSSFSLDSFFFSSFSQPSSTIQ